MTIAEAVPTPLKHREERRKNSTMRRLGRPLKIALLGYRSDPYVGGQGIYLKYLSSALAKLGHEVHVYSGPPYPELEGSVKLVKVPSLDLYAHENHVTALKAKHLLSYTDSLEWWSMLTGGFAEPYTFGRRIARQLAKSDFDIIHDNQSLCFGLLDLQKSGHKVLSTIHHPIHRDRELAIKTAGDWQHRLLAYRWYSFLRMQEKVVPQLKHITTVSNTSMDDIERYFKRKENVRVIPNGIDTEAFRPVRVNRTPYRIITTASSDQPLKGLCYLLEALAQIAKSYPDVHLRIIGKLKSESASVQLIEKLNLGQRVSYRSALSTEQLALEYNKASVAVCPSLYEGFGLPAGEAMACGVPLVSTNGGALAEVVDDAGIVVEAGDASALSAGVQLLFENKELAASLAQNGRQRIIEHYSWQKVAEELTRYYHEIIKSC
ncbi:Glycosyltransferase involved in cell wall bisynthesis [Alteromonadaceae bacterium Bs31]|nr:Glycosyltransferase involved in cell wall bisynthesis [Alteromonadaceae bacterium Bs31]